MKIRNGFVSNSSSSSFVIMNLTDKELTWEDLTAGSAEATAATQEETPAPEPEAEEAEEKTEE